jgi:hypothetical protein
VRFYVLFAVAVTASVEGAQRRECELSRRKEPGHAV